MRRNRLMQLGGLTIIMRIPTRDHAGATGTATAGRQDRRIKAPPRSRQSVDIRRPCGLATITADVTPANVVRDEENHVRVFRTPKVSGAKRESERQNADETSGAGEGFHEAPMGTGARGRVCEDWGKSAPWGAAFGNFARITKNIATNCQIYFIQVIKFMEIIIILC